MPSHGTVLLARLLRDIVDNPGEYDDQERLDIIRVAADHLEHVEKEVQELRREIDTTMKRNRNGT